MHESNAATFSRRRARLGVASSKLIYMDCGFNFIICAVSPMIENHHTGKRAPLAGGPKLEMAGISACCGSHVAPADYQPTTSPAISNDINPQFKTCRNIQTEHQMIPSAHNSKPVATPKTKLCCAWQGKPAVSRSASRSPSAGTYNFTSCEMGHCEIRPSL